MKTGGYHNPIKMKRSKIQRKVFKNAQKQNKLNSSNEKYP